MKLTIRFTPNKLVLIERIVSTSDDIYKHTPIILELVEKLGYRGDRVAQAQVYGMLCDSAISNEEWEVARDYIGILTDMAEPELESAPVAPPRPGSRASLSRAPSRASMRSDVSGFEPEVRDPATEASMIRQVTWRSCLALGRQSEYQNIPDRIALLAQAIALCPPEEVSAILPIWRSAEQLVVNNPALLEPPADEGSGFTASSLSSGIGSVASGLGSGLGAMGGSAMAMGGSAMHAAGFGGFGGAAGQEGDERMLGSRRAARAAKLAMDFGSNLRSFTGSPAQGEDNGDVRGGLVADVDAAADMGRRALVKGVGWLLGADEQHM